jgi:hypothetical protein
LPCGGRGDPQFLEAATIFIGSLSEVEPLALYFLVEALCVRVRRELCALGALLGLESIMFGSCRHGKGSM